MTSTLSALQDWVDSVAKLTQPEDIHWCSGSDSEYKRLINQMQRSGDLLELNSDSYPHCFLHRSDPSDVARVEHLTFVCTENESDAGPNNIWMQPEDAHRKIDGLFDGAMQGRTMYVIPYCMGPIDSPYCEARCRNNGQPLRRGQHANDDSHGRRGAERIEQRRSIRQGPALHRRPRSRTTLHHAFPEELSIKSIGSGYGGNALAWQKVPCAANRKLAGPQGRLAGRTYADRGYRESRGSRPITSPARSRPPVAKPTWRC